MCAQGTRQRRQHPSGLWDPGCTPPGKKPVDLCRDSCIMTGVADTKNSRRVRTSGSLGCFTLALLADLKAAIDHAIPEPCHREPRSSLEKSMHV